MEPFDTIEKWINEHGSASILRDHIALLKEQMLGLQAKVTRLEDKIMTLETENTELRLQLQTCKANLKQQTNNSQQLHDAPPRSNNDHKILELLAKQPNLLSAEQIAQTLGTNLEKIKYELEELRKANLITYHKEPFNAFNPPRQKLEATWTLTHAGTDYRIKHGLLK